MLPVTKLQYQSHSPCVYLFLSFFLFDPFPFYRTVPLDLLLSPPSRCSSLLYEFLSFLSLSISSLPRCDPFRLFRFLSFWRSSFIYGHTSNLIQWTYMKHHIAESAPWLQTASRDLWILINHGYRSSVTGCENNSLEV